MLFCNEALARYAHIGACCTGAHEYVLLAQGESRAGSSASDVIGIYLRACGKERIPWLLTDGLWNHPSGTTSRAHRESNSQSMRRRTHDPFHEVTVLFNLYFELVAEQGFHCIEPNTLD